MGCLFDVVFGARKSSSSAFRPSTFGCVAEVVDY